MDTMDGENIDTEKIAERYTYRIEWSEDDQEYAGLCAELPSLSWLARTHAKALEGIRKVVHDALADMKKSHEPIPQALVMRQYSGQFRVRLPPFVHRQLAIEAAERGISLNRLISAKLAQGS